MSTKKTSDNYSDRKGYSKKFISNKDSVSLPDFSKISNIFKAGIKKESVYEIPYYNFSVILHSKRKLPLFTACNIDGDKFVDTERKNSWRDDPRAKGFTLGRKLYSAEKSNFDKGHMTAREDPAWGDDKKSAFLADQDTFHYTNAVPQHHGLNNETWKELEQTVLKKGTIKSRRKICVFTGPVLDENDPLFVTKVDGEEIQIPLKFWKVIVWKKKDKGLHAVGFVMSQEDLLKRDNTIKTKARMKAAMPPEDIFENIKFKDGKSYQVQVSLIEKSAKIKFGWKNVKFPYKEKTAREMKSAAKTKTRGIARTGAAVSTEITNMEL